jgi:hypothetical protein
MGVSSARPSAEDYTKMMMDVAPAARMMLRVLIPAGVQKPQIQMIANTPPPPI